jgi:3',5'-cyclic AMP phosphodiesterase CpdA
MHVVRIAHISDLHFDRANTNLETWRLLSRRLTDVQPELLLVTGDIVNSPDDQSYEKAHDALETLCRDIGGAARPIPYFVCPGNHDRHDLGNAAPRTQRRSLLNRLVGKLAAPFRSRTQRRADAFDRIFQGRIALAGRDGRRDLLLGPSHNQWTVRILGVDSSINADVSARGFVSYGTIETIKEAMSNADDVDFSILLVHHHLLPVRSLENARQGSIGDLAALTTLINAGTLVEALAAAHVDVALHGHEHAANWGRYATLELGGGETTVVGAGSATGAVTLKPCDPGRVSFNVVELGEDRKVSFTEHRYDGARVTWTVNPPFEIYDSEGLRRARFLRRAGSNIQRAPESDVVRYIEFTSERDGIVRERRTNVDFRQDPILVIAAKNRTGTPTDLKIKLTSPNGEAWTPDQQPFFRQSDKERDAWIYQCNLPRRITSDFQTLEFSYRWLGGAVLTAEEIEAIDEPSRGEFRKDGYEFGAIRVDGYFREMRLVIKLPPEFAPANESDDVETILQDLSLESSFESSPLPQADVINRLRLVGRGLYSLVIPYPRRGYLYGVKWKVPAARPLDAAGAQFIEKARANGDKLAEVFHGGLAKTGISASTTVALYVPNDRRNLLNLAGGYPPGSALPKTIDPAMVDNIAAQAWRGATSGVVRSSSGSAAFRPEVGFEPEEAALLAIPVRFGVDWINDAPWGVVRVGLGTLPSEIAAIGEPGQGSALRNALLYPMILMLGEAGIGLSDRRP